MTKKQKKMLIRILVSAAMLVVLELVPQAVYTALDASVVPNAGRLVRLGLYLVNYWIIGGDILKKAWKGIRNRQLLDECFLMAVATLGALALAIYENGDYREAIAVMLFYQIGEWFQSYAVGKSRRSIAGLMDIRPDSANLETDGGVEQVDPELVAVGSIIQIRPGEKVPIDGVVVEGTSSLNTVALTGESLPREAGSGTEIISGSVNLTGLLRVRTTREFGESTVSKILELVENASSRKSRSEEFIAKFARVYTPAVCLSAAALALLPPLLSLVLGAAPLWGQWCYRALTFLVISCPCALVISIPLSFFAGIGGASREGVLVKGSNYLETLSKVDTVVFDKTGTLTQGVFQVTEVHADTMDTERLLEYTALAESASTHPISRSLREACGEVLDLNRVSDIQEISGGGVTAKVDGIVVAAGNRRLMEKLGVSCPERQGGGTTVHVCVDGAYAGYIVISDRLKPNAAAAVEALRKAGVKRTVMLTGDVETVARETAEAVGVDEYHAGLLPGDKVDRVEALLNRRSRGALAFVGDGVNDAPVLARADVGIAMGGIGSDAAIEAADVVLMDDDPLKLVKAIRISRKCLGIVQQNIVFAIGVKLLCLLLGALGMANMWLAIFADVGVMVLAVLNAIRALFVKKL